MRSPLQAPSASAELRRRPLAAARPAGAGEACDADHAKPPPLSSDPPHQVPYDRWREYDAEDTVGFYALRLRETCMIKSSPQKIIADGTDWHFLNELKRELKA